MAHLQYVTFVRFVSKFYFYHYTLAYHVVFERILVFTKANIIFRRPQLYASLTPRPYRKDLFLSHQDEPELLGYQEDMRKTPWNDKYKIRAGSLKYF